MDFTDKTWYINLHCTLFRPRLFKFNYYLKHTGLLTPLLSIEYTTV